jgi:hypothetical protein
MYFRQERTFRTCLRRHPHIPGTTRTLSSEELAQVNIWNSIPGSSQWLQNIQSNDEAILLHCYYDAETQFPQSTANDIFDHPNDHVNMFGERFSIDHRELDNVADNNENERDTIKYFIVTTREINNKINVDPHTPVITSESEFTDYINTICQRIFEERHPEETVPLFFFTRVFYTLPGVVEMKRCIIALITKDSNSSSKRLR